MRGPPPLQCWFGCDSSGARRQPIALSIGRNSSSRSFSSRGHYIRRSTYFDDTHFSHEPVSAPAQGLDEARVGRIIPQDETQLIDRLVQAMVAVSVRLPRPEDFDKLSSVDPATGPIEQAGQ